MVKIKVSTAKCLDKSLWFSRKVEGMAEKLQPVTEQLIQPGRFRGKCLRILTPKATLQSSCPEVAQVDSQPECSPHVYFVWPVTRN